MRAREEDLCHSAKTALLGTVLLAVLMLIVPRLLHAQSPWTPQYIVDLSHDLHEGFPWINVPSVTFPFSKTPIASIEEFGVAANSWTIHEHLGTQIDAPNHFARGGAEHGADQS